MDVFDLFAKLSLDSSEYESGLVKAKKALGTMGKAVGVAVGAATAAVGALTKSAVDSYAEYEQLVGGVETLFKESADIVQEYAANAYKTAGLSANEYMETVTSFSASLLQSLGGDTQKAAEVSDMAITDMADNANKMGTSMESIQAAYQGFAKGQYQLLDNLKLGYGGTKEEMERLLADAEAFSGVHYDISNLNDVYEAIHVIQTELGITGTTAKEASETISGSAAAVRSAWKNLVTGLADDNADLDLLIGNVVDSAETALKNIIPVAEKALSGIAELIEKLAPIIAEKLPALVQAVLPDMINAAVEIVQGLVNALPTVISALIDALPVVISQLANTIIDVLPQLVELGVQLALALAQGVADNIDQLIPAFAQMIQRVVEILTDPQLLAQIAYLAVEIVISLGEGLIKALPYLLDALGELLGNVITTTMSWAGELVQQVWDACINSIKKAVQAVELGLQELWDTAISWIKKFFNIGYEIVEGIWNGIKRAWDWLVEQWNKLWDNLLGGVKNLLGIHSPSKKFAEIGKYMALGVGEGWNKAFSAVQKDIDGSFDFGEKSISFSGGSFGDRSYTGGGAQTALPNLVLETEGDIDDIIRLIRPRLKWEDSRVGQPAFS